MIHDIIWAASHMHCLFNVSVLKKAISDSLWTNWDGEGSRVHVIIIYHMHSSKLLCVLTMHPFFRVSGVQLHEIQVEYFQNQGRCTLPDVWTWYAIRTLYNHNYSWICIVHIISFDVERCYCYRVPLCTQNVCNAIKWNLELEVLLQNCS